MNGRLLHMLWITVLRRMSLQDLEYLIEKSVSIDRADFAVVAGIQIHNWSGGPDATEPNLEFIAPTKVWPQKQPTCIPVLAVPSN